MKRANTIPQCMVAGIEFFMMNGEIQFIENGVQKSFSQLDVDQAYLIRQMMDVDPSVEKGMALMGIHDPVQQLEQFVFCRFGNFDNVADLAPDGTVNYEYWECGCRPCPADGILCRYPAIANGRITRHDAQVMRQVAADLPNKLIADNISCAKSTVDKEVVNLIHKIGCHTKAGLSAFAASHNIL